MKILDRSKNIFTLKLIGLFSMILILSFVFILIFSSQYLDQKAIGLAKSENIKAVSTLQSYMKEKNMTTKRILVQLYNSRSYSEILDTLENPLDMEAANIWLINEYTQLGLSSDNDLVNIALINLHNNKMYYATKGTTEITELQKGMRARLSDYSQALKFYGTNILPSFLDKTFQYNRYLMPIASRIKNTNMKDDLGYLLTEYNCSNLDIQLKSFTEAYPFSKLYILGSDGMVIYDSERELVNVRYPYFVTIKSEGSGMYNIDQPSYVEQIYDPSLDMYFVCTIPLDQLYKDIRTQKSAIYLVIIACVILALIATYFFTMHYSRRVSILYQTIGIIRSGNLSVRVPKSRVKDEISQISDSINEMCDMLESYIDRVYISEIQSKENDIRRKDAELKQKTAQLYALQAQINPHFLYNSLESIRMRALSYGSRDVANMAYILSTLFRQSLKPDLIVSISNEIENCKLYLEMTKLRYPDKINISFEIADDALACGIIRHILQPVIENSVNHGIDINKSVNHISVSVSRRNSQLVLQVMDNGKGIEADRLEMIQTGLYAEHTADSAKIGIFNVNRRIKMIFGGEYGLEIESKPLAGTVTTIRIPALEMEEMKSYVQCFNS